MSATIARRVLAGGMALLCGLSCAAQDAGVLPGPPPGLEWRELGGYAKLIATRFGDFSVHALGPDRERATFVEFRLAGELAMPPLPRRSELFSVSLRRVFELGERDVVVATASTGGSADPPRLLLVEVHRDLTADLATDPAFRSIDSTELVATDGARLYFDLGWDSGRRKMATFDDGLELVYPDVAPSPVAEDRCRRLFDVMTNACASPERHPQWGAPGELIHGPFDHATARFLLGLTNHPGFRREEFLLQCAAAPELERAASYETFAAEICGP